MVEEEPVRVAVVADTHVPDRVNALHPALLEELSAWKVALILHAGDISTPKVLDELRQVAHVEAAIGNRDWSLINRLPLVNRVQVGNQSIALMHGHGGWWRYLWDKGVYLARGYQFSRYQKVLLAAAPQADIIVFGHTHRVENTWLGKQLLFNPGSASFGFRRNLPPSYGILEFKAGLVTGRVVPLKGYQVDGGYWKKID